MSAELRLVDIKTRLRQARLATGISTTELAEKVGKSSASIRRLENPASDSLCDFMVFAEICHHLEVNSEYILSGERRESAAVSDAEFEVRNREANSRLSRRQQIALMNMILAMTVGNKR
jgi:transcriptional regulator with XRE-family HTH domain